MRRKHFNSSQSYKASKRGQDKVVELWHANCQQLLTHDSEMLGKEREIKVLCDRLHKAEMQLATLKLERLCGGTYTSVSQPTSTNFVGPVAEGTSPNPLGPEGHNNKPTITAPPPWSLGSVALRQLGIVATTLPLLQLAKTVTNTQSTLSSDLSSVRSSGEQVQPEVPISSVGPVTTGTFPAMVAPWHGIATSHNAAVVRHLQLMNLLVKTAGLLSMTGYPFLKEQLIGMDGHKMSC